jgi:hypothetical protein
MRERYDFGPRTRERIQRVRRLLRAGHGETYIAAVLDTSLRLARRYAWLARQKGTGKAGNLGGVTP